MKTIVARNLHVKPKCVCLLLVLHIFTFTYSQIKVIRLNSNEPIINRSMLPYGWTINGPSMLRIPDWVPASKRADPKAIYYLYFAGHTDPYIKLAWSENVAGPYQIYNPNEGVFHLTNYRQPKRLKISHHIASPDVYADSINQQFIMYFHAGKITWNGDSLKAQRTVVAISDFGLDFNTGLQDVIICPFYARIFKHEGSIYALCKDGIYKPPNPDYPWEFVDNFNRLNQYLWKKAADPFRQINKQERHFALLQDGDDMHVMYSRIASSPEHIEYSKIRTNKNIKSWKPSQPIDILYPEYEWEGISYKIVESEEGPENTAQALRDPYLFLDKDSSIYLLYTGAGEQSIGIAKIEGLLDINPFSNDICRCPDSLMIYPNPSSEGIIHLVGLNNRVIIEVYSISGELIMNKRISDMNSHILDLSRYHGVSLFIHIIDESYSCWKKIIIT